MRPPFAICSALVLGAALHGAGLSADDGAFRPVAGPGSDLPVMVSQQAAEAFAAPPASSTGFGPVINAGMSHDEVAPQPPAATQEQALRHCSIVGAVNNPGTYAGEHPSVLLRTLIEQAGGLTEQAAGTVRILHDGRQQIIDDIAAAEAAVVPAESVIVVDARHAGPHAAAGDSRLYTDVACLQLCDRPAVLCLDPATATLPKLLAMLGQPAELAATVRIITPHDQYPSSGTLSSGSVIIFDPQALDQRALADVFQRWPLNDLILIENPDHQQVAAETMDLLQFLESRMQPALETELAPVDSDNSATQPPAALLAPAPGPESNTATLTGSTAPLSEAFDPFPTAAVEAEDEGVRPASAVQLRSVGSPPVLPTQTAELSVQDVVDPSFDSVEADFEPLSASAEILPSVDSDPRSQWLQFGSSVAAWLLCGLAGWGVFNLWMRQHERRRRTTLQRNAETEALKPTISLPSRSALSHVIDNSLPFREEETPTPSQAFHGRTVGFRYLIRSGPHPLQGPHFAASRVQPATPRAAAAATEGRDVPPRTTARTPVNAGRSINRVDTAAVAEQNLAERIPAATERSAARGVSPLERALRSILREGRDHAQ